MPFSRSVSLWKFLCERWWYQSLLLYTRYEKDHLFAKGIQNNRSDKWPSLCFQKEDHVAPLPCRLPFFCESPSLTLNLTVPRQPWLMMVFSPLLALLSLSVILSKMGTSPFYKTHLQPGLTHHLHQTGPRVNRFRWLQVWSKAVLLYCLLCPQTVSSTVLWDTLFLGHVL
jgi:hypothetical protein